MKKITYAILLCLLQTSCLWAYTLTLKADGCENAKTFTIEDGTQLTIDAVPNAGYGFLKWNDGNTDNPRTVTVTANKTYTASFVAVYTITAKANNTSYGTVSGGGEYNVNTTATLTATPKSGYKFVQWDDGNTDNPRTVTVTGDKTYTATFAVAYTITAKSNNTSYGTVSGGGAYNVNATATLIATPKSGYKFVQWDDGSTQNPRTITVTGDKTYTANFEGLPYTITAKSADNSMGTVSGSGVYKCGSYATLTAIANDHYGFLKWSDDNIQNPRSFYVTKDSTFTAIFSKSYMMNVHSNDISLGEVKVSRKEPYLIGDTIRLSAIENCMKGVFVGWSDGVTDKEREIILTQDTIITAIFRKITSQELQSNVHNYIQIALRGDFVAYPRYCPFWLNVYTVQSTTDELAIPACGQTRNWLDQGIYLQLMQHTWNASNPVFESCWTYCYKMVEMCNDFLQYSIEGTKAEAQLRLLRAYAYYRLMDLFGGVPIITDKSCGEIYASSRAEVFAFVEKELTSEAMNNLPLKEYGGMDKGVLHTLKARLYLNSKVFLGLDDESSAYKTYLNKCITECDNVTNSSQYAIEPNIYKNFYYDNDANSSSENIFVIEYNNDGSTLGNRMQMTSYYKKQDLVFGAEMYQHTTGGWKLCPGKTVDDPDGTFKLFNKYDNRRLSILWGQQYDKQTGEKIIDGRMYDKEGKVINDTINYTPFFDRGMTDAASVAGKEGLMNCARNGDGARIIKFELEADPKDYESGVDMVVMRYAEVLYMKAECLIRLHRNSESVPLFKEVLQYRGYDYDNIEYYAKTPSGGSVTYDFDKDEGKDASWSQALMSKRWLRPTSLTNIIPSSPNLKFMDDELRREFLWEDHRRTDMIRMGKFINGTWGGHLTPTLDKSKEVFPVPAAVQIPANVECGIKINAYSNDATMGEVAGGGRYEENATAELTAIPYTGYEFVQWNDGVTVNPRTITVTGEATYTATFKKKEFTVKTKTIPAMAGTVTGGGKYSYGTQINLSATTNFGYDFERWSDGMPQTSRTVIITQDTTFTALYNAQLFSITLMTNNETMGDVAGEGSYEYNKVATLLGIPNSGFKFVQWSDGSTENPHYVKVLGDKIYIATFATGTPQEEKKGEKVEKDGVEVTPYETKADFNWPSITGVASYSLVIWQDVAQTQKVCTLTFNAAGQLTNIDFTQSVKEQSYTQETIGGLNFTVTGLKRGTTYGYTLDSKDAEEEIISHKTGTFTTQGVDGIAEITAAGISVYAEGRNIIIENAEGNVTVSDALGRVVCRDAVHCVSGERRTFAVPAAGVYMVKIGNNTASIFVNN